jgi:hypothetical protein
MESPKESLEKKNIFAEKYDEIRRLDGTRGIFFNSILSRRGIFLPHTQ